ncbi:MAG TPA: DNA alkylation repair protein, partial [Vicinamibacterales bacterium]|nr:DNA alkylation repair protein [Vicinamibacterales bacterium]
IDDAMAFATLLIRDRHLEAKCVGVEVVARYRREFSPRLLPAWKRWLGGNHSANWATTDAICGILIGPLLVMHPTLASGMRAWTRDRNMWVRRASAVGLIGLARKGAAFDIIYSVARTLHRDREDLIQKAVGWMLREAGKQDAPRLEQYLRANGPSIPRTTVRYAIERFPEAKRRALLVATRGSNG